MIDRTFINVDVFSTALKTKYLSTLAMQSSNAMLNHAPVHPMPLHKTLTVVSLKHAPR